MTHFFKQLALNCILTLLLIQVSYAQEADLQKLPKPKNEAKAYLIELAHLAVPLVIGFTLEHNVSQETQFIFMGYSAIIAPSAGQLFYAQDSRRAKIGIGIRSISGLILAIGIKHLLFDTKGEVFAAFVIIPSAAAMIGSGVYNFLTLSKSVREYNLRNGFVFDVQPQLFRIGNRNATGLTATIRL